MRKRILVMFAAMVAAFALAGASAAAANPAKPDFTAEALASGLSRAEASDLQDRVDEVLAEIPGGTQVSATEISYDGMIATVDSQYEEGDYTIAAGCPSGAFCINVRGTEFVFIECKRWTLSDWWGSAPWANNQTGRVLARAYAANGSTIVWSDWSNDYPDTGTVRDVAPWYFFRPC